MTPEEKAITHLPGVTDISGDPAINNAVAMLEDAIVKVVLGHIIAKSKDSKKVSLSLLPHNINTATLCIVRAIIDDMLKTGLKLYSEGVKNIDLQGMR